LVNELIPPEIIPIIWFAGITISVYFFFRKFSDVIKEKIKHTTRKNKTVDTEETGNQIDNLINNAPRILDEVNKEIESQREKGVTDEQMKGLLQKKQLLELGTSIPPEVYNIVAKPVIKKLIGFIGKI
jgi:type III secretion system FlhB-like substrate exporter